LEQVECNGVNHGLKRGRNEFDSPVKQDSFKRQLTFMCEAFNNQKKALELKHSQVIELFGSNNGTESVKSMLRRLKKENHAFKKQQIEVTAYIDTMETDMKSYAEKVEIMKSSLDDLVESVRVQSGV
jgi:predicted transcriptional regulator